MDRLEEKYKQVANTWTDIQKHMPVIKEYASKCDHVTEFGVDDGTSTWALMAGKPKVIHCYDILPCPNLGSLIDLARENNIDFNFHFENTLEIEIDPTDLLIIDSLHTYTQVKTELKLHASKVKKYLLFHDIVSFGHKGGGGTLEQISKCPYYQTKGVLDAVEEFESNNIEWSSILKDFNDPYGFAILERESVI